MTEIANTGDGALDRTAGLYEQFLRVTGEKTLRNYRIALETFARWWLGKPDVRHAVERFVAFSGPEANALVLDYRSYLEREHVVGATGRRGAAPSTVNQHLSALRAVVRLGRLTGRCGFTLEVPGVEVATYRDTAGPGREAYQEMLAFLHAEVADEWPEAWRDIVILRFLHDMGLRRSELLSIEWPDGVNLKKREVLIKPKKKRQMRWWPVGRAAFEALQAWLKVRGREPGPLITSYAPGKEGRPLNPRSVNTIVARIAEAVGVHATPHGFRHTAITTALDMTGGDMRTVQRFSRHANPKTLTAYDDRRRDAPRELADKLGENDEE